MLQQYKKAKITLNNIFKADIGIAKSTTAMITTTAKK